MESLRGLKEQRSKKKNKALRLESLKRMQKQKENSKDPQSLTQAF